MTSSSLAVNESAAESLVPVGCGFGASMVDIGCSSSFWGLLLAFVFKSGLRQALQYSSFGRTGFKQAGQVGMIGLFSLGYFSVSMILGDCCSRAL